ncbi:hypothetical protein [Kamptonema formosum]|uniref:hypothetical protein n=1 Tax=Kamptonema formosum TaxID=331992 RepID=UPI0012DE48C1|nr:hypothetical protein [Oscillatoria sp. PCC 10802]
MSQQCYPSRVRIEIIAGFGTPAILGVHGPVLACGREDSARERLLLFLDGTRVSRETPHTRDTRV